MTDMQAFLFVVSVLSLLGLGIVAFFYAAVSDTVLNYGKRNSRILGFFRVLFDVGMLAPLIILLAGENQGNNRAIWLIFLVIESIMACLLELVALGDKLARKIKTTEEIEKG